MTTVDLASCVAKSSAATILTNEDKQIYVLPENGSNQLRHIITVILLFFDQQMQKYVDVPLDKFNATRVNMPYLLDSHSINLLGIDWQRVTRKKSCWHWKGITIPLARKATLLDSCFSWIQRLLFACSIDCVLFISVLKVNAPIKGSIHTMLFLDNETLKMQMCNY